MFLPSHLYTGSGSDQKVPAPAPQHCWSRSRSKTDRLCNTELKPEPPGTASFLPGAGADPSSSEPESAPGSWPSGAGAARKSGGSATLWGRSFSTLRPYTSSFSMAGKTVFWRRLAFGSRFLYNRIRCGRIFTFIFFLV